MVTELVNGATRVVVNDAVDVAVPPASDLLRPRGGKVYLVDHGNDLEVLVDGEVGVDDGLGLNALGGVGGQTGRSYWWAPVALPYPAGWIL